jgi:hypothetical protein
MRSEEVTHAYRPIAQRYHEVQGAQYKRYHEIQGAQHKFKKHNTFKEHNTNAPFPPYTTHTISRATHTMSRATHTISRAFAFSAAATSSSSSLFLRMRSSISKSFCRSASPNASTPRDRLLMSSSCTCLHVQHAPHAPHQHLQAHARTHARTHARNMARIKHSPDCARMRDTQSWKCSANARRNPPALTV